MKKELGIGLVFVFFLLLLTKGNAAGRRPAFAKRTLYAEPSKDLPGPEKNYTGIRVRDDTLLLVYFHEQTIAVVELGHDRQLFNCELLEVRTKPDKKVALGYLKPIVPVHIRISFPEMIKLMDHCQKLEAPGNLDSQFVSVTGQITNISPTKITSIFSGVLPGTKWCGAGDIAGSYHDLGTDLELDKCCRTHDLCPVKVAGLKTQYNITNYSLYTKSHCQCDDVFYHCLKTVDSAVSNLLGNIYFNVAQVPCVEDILPSDPSVMVKKRFSPTIKRY